MKSSTRKRILYPSYIHPITAREGMRLLLQEETDSLTKARFSLTILIDEEDGVIADASFSAFGPSYLILTGDLLSELIIRKTHVQAGKITASMLEKAAEPFPLEEVKWINFALHVLDEALDGCRDMQHELRTPLENAREGEENYHEEFPLLSKSEKIALIETVLDEEIRPYIAMDEGGVQIKDLEGEELKILYEGACTSCYAASGSTLSAIQNILQTKVHPKLTVTPVDLFV